MAGQISRRHLTGRQPQMVARVRAHYRRLSGGICGHGDVMLKVGSHLLIAGVDGHVVVIYFNGSTGCTSE